MLMRFGVALAALGMVMLSGVAAAQDTATPQCSSATVLYTCTYQLALTNHNRVNGQPAYLSGSRIQSACGCGVGQNAACTAGVAAGAIGAPPNANSGWCPTGVSPAAQSLLQSRAPVAVTPASAPAQ